MLFTIQDIIDTLNKIDVHGRDNLDRMLGVIYALEAMLQAEKNEGRIDLPQPTGNTIKEPVEEPEAEGELTDG